MWLMHDEDRAGGVQGALMADRAEQETGEAAVSTGADDQQIGARACATSTCAG